MSVLSQIAETRDTLFKLSGRMPDSMDIGAEMLRELAIETRNHSVEALRLPLGEWIEQVQQRAARGKLFVFGMKVNPV